MSKTIKTSSKKKTSRKSTTATISKAKTANTSSATQEGSKLATIIGLLRRKEGATIEQMTRATGWQSHSVRGAMSGALKKKRGLAITSVKNGRVRNYSISA